MKIKEPRDQYVIMAIAIVFFLYFSLKGQGIELFDINTAVIMNWSENAAGVKKYLPIVLLLSLMFSIVKFIRPFSLFECDCKGVYLGKNKDFFEWHKVIDIYSGEMKIGTSSNRGKTYTKMTPAVMIKLDDNYLNLSGWHRVAAKPTTANTFGFHHRKSEKTSGVICEFWLKYSQESTPNVKEQIKLSTADQAIKQLIDSGAMVQAIKKCREEYGVGISEAKQIINKIT